MATANTHVGDVVTLRATVLDADGDPVPLVGPITIRLRKPNGTTVDKTGTIVGDGSAGQATYLTSTSDLDRPGAWQAQLKDGDGPWHASIVEFIVDPNLADP